eukprot:2341256-Prymnesium_polylepis.1
MWARAGSVRAGWRAPSNRCAECCACSRLRRLTPRPMVPAQCGARLVARVAVRAEPPGRRVDGAARRCRRSRGLDLGGAESRRARDLNLGGAGTVQVGEYQDVAGRARRAGLPSRNGRTRATTCEGRDWHVIGTDGNVVAI